jgi:hypothetical protein
MTVNHTSSEVYEGEIPASPASRRRDAGLGEGIPVDVRFHESTRSIAWNRLWHKMLSEVLGEQRHTRSPDC